MIGPATGTGRGPATCFCADTLRTGVWVAASFVPATALGAAFAAAPLCVAVVGLRCLRLGGTVPLMPTEASRCNTIRNAVQRIIGDWIDLFIPVRYSPIGEIVEELDGQSSTTSIGAADYPNFDSNRRPVKQNLVFV